MLSIRLADSSRFTSCPLIDLIVVVIQSVGRFFQLPDLQGLL